MITWRAPSPQQGVRRPEQWSRSSSKWDACKWRYFASDKHDFFRDNIWVTSETPESEKSYFGSEKETWCIYLIFLSPGWSVDQESHSWRRTQDGELRKTLSNSWRLHQMSNTKIFLVLVPKSKWRKFLFEYQTILRHLFTLGHCSIDSSASEHQGGKS